MGRYLPPNAVINIMLMVCIASVTYVFFRRIGRVVSQLEFRAAARVPAEFDDLEIPGSGQMRATTNWFLEGISKTSLGNDAEDQIVRRYLALCSRLGLLAVLPLLFGYLSAGFVQGTIVVISARAISLFLVIYFLSDRMMQVVLGSRFRPATQMPKWLERQRSGYHVFAGLIVRAIDPLVVVLVLVAVAFVLEFLYMLAQPFGVFGQ